MLGATGVSETVEVECIIFKYLKILHNISIVVSTPLRAPVMTESLQNHQITMIV